MLNITTGFGREIKDREDIRKDPRFSFRRKPEDEGEMGLNKYGDFLGFGKQAEEKPYLGGYQSPFTTLKSEGWKYDGNKLTSQTQRDRMILDDSLNFSLNKPINKPINKPEQGPINKPRPTPYGSIMNSYKRI